MGVPRQGQGWMWAQAQGWMWAKQGNTLCQVLTAILLMRHPPSIPHPLPPHLPPSRPPHQMRPPRERHPQLQQKAGR